MARIVSYLFVFRQLKFSSKKDTNDNVERFRWKLGYKKPEYWLCLVKLLENWVFVFIKQRLWWLTPLHVTQSINFAWKLLNSCESDDHIERHVKYTLATSMSRFVRQNKQIFSWRHCFRTQNTTWIRMNKQSISVSLLTCNGIEHFHACIFT